MSERICSVSGCHRPLHAKGVCKQHRVHQRAGVPLAPIRPKGGGRSLAERFWEKVEKTEGCWLWMGARNSTGYGHIWMPELGTSIVAHRAVLHIVGREIPDGLQVDHLCRVRHCVNPEHLEPVTASENTRRIPYELRGGQQFQKAKTHCPQGHEYTPENTALVPNAYGVARRCRVCHRAASTRHEAAKRARQKAARVNT